MDPGMQRKWDALATVKSFDMGLTNDITLESVRSENSESIEVINTTTTTPISLLVQSLVQQLCSLLEKDPARANQLYNSICEKLHGMKLIDDTYSMGEFEVMRSQYQRALYQLVAVATGSEIPIPLPVSWPIVQPTGLEWSRYHREFEELFFIAGGGFGSVFKARHRLDGVEYAVKKIYIRSSDVDSVMSHLAEVKTIASLNHINIVNYKAAWLEPMIEQNVKKKRIKMETDDFMFDSTSISSTFPNIIKSFKTHNSKELFHQDSRSDFTITFEKSDELYDDSETSEELDDSDTEKELSANSENMLCKMLYSKEYANCSRVNLKWATLFIQMSFCQQTLKQWLDQRNEHVNISRNFLHHCDSSDSADSTPLDRVMTPPVAWTDMNVLLDMFTQLVRGLHYIHARGIIHHDVKPSNVFVATTEQGVQVQLGDFGLACPLQRSHCGNAFGTHLYAAPEQLEGLCNPKSDMYSLGIILLEIVETFSTDMERVKTITDLRKGQIPTQLTANYPKVAHIIGKLVQRRPSRRLDTAQLLEEFKLLSENKDDTIKSLKEELAAKDDEIARLRLKLAEMSGRT